MWGFSSTTHLSTSHASHYILLISSASSFCEKYLFVMVSHFHSYPILIVWKERLHQKHSKTFILTSRHQLYYNHSSFNSLKVAELVSIESQQWYLFIKNQNVWKKSMSISYLSKYLILFRLFSGDIEWDQSNIQTLSCPRVLLRYCSWLLSSQQESCHHHSARHHHHLCQMRRQYHHHHHHCRLHIEIILFFIDEIKANIHKCI